MKAAPARPRRMIGGPVESETSRVFQAARRGDQARRRRRDAFARGRHSYNKHLGPARYKSERAVMEPAVTMKQELRFRLTLR